MASHNEERLTPKQQVLRELEMARASLAQHVTLAAKEWSPKAMITHSFQRHRALWLGGAALAGLAIVRLFFSGGSNSRRDNSGASATKGGLLALLITPLLAYGRKAALNYGAQMVQSYLRQKVYPNVPAADRV